MADGLLSLSWNNHSATFCHALSSLRTKDRYADVTLSCEGKFYAVHKLVLSTCSEYFDNIFEQTPCKHPIIVLANIQQAELEAILSYMYDGAVTVSQSNLPRLIKVAELLQIKGLAVPDEPPKNISAAHHRRQSQDSSSGKNSPSPRTKLNNASSEISDEPLPKRIRRESDFTQVDPLESPTSVSNSQHQEDSVEFALEEKYDPGSETVVDAELESQTLVSSQDSNCGDYIKKEVTEPPEDSESSIADPGVTYIERGLSDVSGGDSLEPLKHTQSSGLQSLLRQESYSEEINTTVAGPSGMQTWFGSEPLNALPASKTTLASDNQFFGYTSPQPTQKRETLLCDGCSRWQYERSENDVTKDKNRTAVKEEHINRSCYLCNPNLKQEEECSTTLEISTASIDPQPKEMPACTNDYEGITYQKILSQRGHHKLLDSLGYAYTVKRITRTAVHWRCAVRNNNVNCNMTIKEECDKFTRGLYPHTHSPSVYQSRSITIFKKKAVEKVF
ncbi:modifier of mdg4-like isoform X2 [Portunus trituberculatus]|uniref:modifier of mdg4-like isoform X2 n=1 Tax=Portunus trituberculatus TaxID=210409 RepID=UPI001E1CB79D|nr:modifier of mdg4-like isoform X2 [Portunus trituberculatus]XP_045113194.1 modifier of mdg4-like isoform X2 [Portunus trituberculatus]XP_045113195.1 modifier of mdg4-like isoform X2 [Portunus trituberculatus]XP_045113196.1 modifier of mdg4-like isoform X2 [Portunus trituberculatus]